MFASGSEPDPRFTLANERTFLAWIRTALALSAAGVALEALAVPIAPGLRLASALVLIALGILAPVQAWLGWAATERAMRTGQALPPPRMGPLLAAGALVAGALLFAGLLLR